MDSNLQVASEIIELDGMQVASMQHTVVVQVNLNEVSFKHHSKLNLIYYRCMC